MQSTRMKGVINVLKALALLALLLVIMLNGNRKFIGPSQPDRPPAEAVEDDEGRYTTSISIPQSEPFVEQSESTTMVSGVSETVEVDRELQRLKTQLEKDFDALANRAAMQSPNKRFNNVPDAPVSSNTVHADEDTFASRMTVTLKRDWEAILKDSPTEDSQALAREVLAKRMYDRGCQFMDSETKRDYSMALAFFRKAIEIQPDSDSIYHKKAQERIERITSSQLERG